MKEICASLAIIFFATGILRAQNPINTDRPDQSDGTHIVEKKHLQIETGVQFSKLDKNTSSFDNETLIRYGVTRRFEVRLLNEYSSIRDSNSIAGFQPLTVSFKNQLCNQHGLLPKITLVSYFRLPITLSKAFKADHFGYTFTIAARYKLSDKLKLYSNFGVTQDQETTDINYPGTFEVNYNLTDRLSAYAEYYGNYAAHTNAENGLDAGFIYTIKNNFAVDLAFGSSTMVLSSNRFVSVGTSLRLPR
jgi:hypothetical protein